MLKRILLAGFCAGMIFLAGCHGTDSTNTTEEKKDTAYAIIGKVTGQDIGIIDIDHRQSGKIDSAFLDHGFFKFSGKADIPELCTIDFDGHSKTFFLENGKISMLIKKDSLRYALISGTKTQDEYNYFTNQFSKSVTDQLAKVDTAYDAANQKKNQRATDSLYKRYEALDLELKQLVVDFTKSHTASVVSAFEIYSNFSYNPRLGQIDSFYHLLDSPARISYFGKQILISIEKVKLTAIGRPAPEFTCNDTNGNPVTLSSFRGTYTLIDFWASWCGPCRLENPNIVKAYNQFKKKGFNIFGVSLDETKQEWLKAIKKDRLNWTQVADLKGWKSGPALLYGVKGIPMNYLLDKKGIIVARGLRGGELESKLTEMLH